jgi:F0F1-type ATP synthase beta subunit
VPLAETLKGCRAILDGTSDNWGESSLYMVGTIAEAREKEIMHLAAHSSGVCLTSEATIAT